MLGVRLALPDIRLAETIWLVVCAWVFFFFFNKKAMITKTNYANIK